MKLAAIQAAVIWLGLSACAATSAENKVEKRFEVEFQAITDDGRALAEAKFQTGNRELGATDGAGYLRTQLQGAEGQTIPITVKCPTGHAAEPTAPLRLARLRGLDRAAAKPLQSRAICARSIRDIALVVHANHGGGLPVRVDGKVAATTDPDGNAHVLLQVDHTARTLHVELDTTPYPKLTPTNPSRAFELSGTDTILILEQNFVLPKPQKKRKPRPLPPKQPQIPYRIE